MVERQCFAGAYVSLRVYISVLVSNTPHTLSIVNTGLAGLEPLDVYSTVGCRPNPNGSPNGTVQMYWHEFHWLQPFNALAPGILNNIKFTLTLLNSSG